MPFKFLSSHYTTIVKFSRKCLINFLNTSCMNSCHSIKLTIITVKNEYKEKKHNKIFTFVCKIVYLK